jgi:hypothetical protein
VLLTTLLVFGSVVVDLGFLITSGKSVALFLFVRADDEWDCPFVVVGSWRDFFLDFFWDLALLFLIMPAE